MRKTLPKSYEYIEKLSNDENTNQINARENSDRLGLGAISLSKTEARILRFIVQLNGANKVVEIGTLTGLSALYILEALGPDGFLWTLEKSPEHAALAEKALESHIRNKQCKVLVGDAELKLTEIESEGPFDAVFIDGNKAAYLTYFNWAVKNVRAGGLIVADNVFLAGAVWGDMTSQKFGEKQVKAVSEMNSLAFSAKNLQSLILPTEEGLLICKKLF